MIISALLLSSVQAKRTPSDSALEDFFRSVETRPLYAQCQGASYNYRVWLSGSSCRVERSAPNKAPDFAWIAADRKVLSIDYAAKRYLWGFDLPPGIPVFKTKPHQPSTLDKRRAPMPYPLDDAFHWPGPGWKLVARPPGLKRTYQATSLNPYNTGHWAFWSFEGTRLVAFDWGEAGERRSPDRHLGFSRILFGASIPKERFSLKPPQGFWERHGQ